MLSCEIHIRTLPHYEGLPLPTYMTAGSSGLDLFAAIRDPIPLGIGERCKVPAGIRVAVPEGFEGQVRPRSGLAASDGITILNTPGTIDSDYRGEIQIILYNAGESPFTIERGMRIGQLVIAPVVKARFIVVDNLSTTIRGEGGFGHTG